MADAPHAGYVALPDSERSARPTFAPVGPADPNEQVRVVVKVRPKSGLACQRRGSPAPSYACVRSVSDPQIDSAGVTLTEEKQTAGDIHSGYGPWSTVCSAVSCWATVASERFEHWQRMPCKRSMPGCRRSDRVPCVTR